MTRNFSKVTAAVLATLTISAAAVSFTTENASAGGRGERMGMGRMGHAHNMGHIGHRGGHGYRHGGHGFGRSLGAGMAVGMIGAAIIAANEHRATVARIRYDQAVRKAPNKPPVVIAKKKTRECEVVEALETLLKSAEETLATDKRMNAQYGEDVRGPKGDVVRTNHSSDHTRFQEQEVERLREQLRKAKLACKPPAAG